MQETVICKGKRAEGNLSCHKASHARKMMTHRARNMYRWRAGNSVQVPASFGHRVAHCENIHGITNAGHNGSRERYARSWWLAQYT